MIRGRERSGRYGLGPTDLFRSLQVPSWPSQRFDAASGEPLGTWGVIGSGPGEFILPTSLTVDSVGNNRIQVFRP